MSLCEVNFFANTWQSSMLTVQTLINNHRFVLGLNIGGMKYVMPTNWASETLHTIIGSTCHFDLSS